MFSVRLGGATLIALCLEMEKMNEITPSLPSLLLHLLLFFLSIVKIYILVGVLVSQGCCNKVLQTDGLNNRNLIFSQLWRLDICLQFPLFGGPAHSKPLWGPVLTCN